MQMRVVACLGVMEPCRRRCGESAELIAGNRYLSEGLFRGKVKMAIFRMQTHNENDTIMTGSTRQRSGVWNHLDKSYG